MNRREIILVDRRLSSSVWLGIAALDLRYAKIWMIRQEEFASMPALRSVQLPDSVMEIGKKAFAFCPNLEEFRCPPRLLSLIHI